MIKVGDRVITKASREEFIVGVVEQDERDPNLQWIWSIESKELFDSGDDYMPFCQLDYGYPSCNLEIVENANASI